MKVCKYNTSLCRRILLIMSVMVLLVLATGLSYAEEDITPPQLQSLSIAPTTVDVSTQSQTVTFTAHITDNPAGFAWGSITITSPSGNQSSSANAVFSLGSSLDGIWIFPITIDKSAENGTWKVTQIVLQDNAGNNISSVGGQEIQVTADTVQPHLQSLSIAPTTIDVSTQSQTINFTARITDDLSDFSWGVITITSPSANQSSSANAVFFSGNSRDGYWVFPITIPKSTEPGTWKVTEIRLQDVAGNNALSTGGQEIQVISDLTPPQLQLLSFAPTTVDVSTQSQTITFTAHITDNHSGFNGGIITITSPSGNQTSAANAVYFSGDPLDGVWTFPITIPKSSEAGTWKVTEIRLQDVAGNNALSTGGQEIQVTGTSDIAPPQLLPPLSIAPTTIDVDAQSQTINITAHITDNLTGFHWGMITLTSPSGIQSSNPNTVLSSGSSLDGFWTFPITIPNASESVLWKITAILLQDSAGNFTDEFTEKRGIQVTAPDALSPILTVFALANGTVTTDAALNISGAVTDSDGIQSLMIKDITVPVTGGTFSTTITLNPGANIITTVATDSLGNHTTDTRTIILVSQIIPGDVNLSGSVDLTDAILSLQVLSGMTPAQTVYREADVNGDNRIGIAEVIYILQKVAEVR